MRFICPRDRSSRRRAGFSQPEALAALVTALLALFAPLCAGDQPYFVAAECAGPEFDDREGVRCGFVFNVPLDRDDPSAGTHVLAVAHVPPRGEGSLTSATLLRLQGGPGIGLVQTVGGWADSAERDLFGIVVMDYRGLGRSYPRLDCPEKLDAFRRNSETADPFRVEAERIRQAMATCRARAEAEGTDLTHYDTSALADDVEAVRVALGIDQWDLVAVSYGTTVAIEIMRRYPETVRSATLDGTYPPDRNTIEDQQGAIDYGLSLYDQACPPGSACNEGPETISELFQIAVARLDAEPAELEIVDRVTGEPRTLVLDGGDFANGVLLATGFANFAPFVPPIIRGAALLGNVDFMIGVVPEEEDVFSEFALLASTTIECRDRGSQIDFEEIVAAVAERPEFAKTFQSGAFVGNGTACDPLEVGSSPDAFRERIESDIPTLIIAGRWDTITPPEWGEALLPGLPNARSYVFPRLAHDIWDEDPCTYDISLQFLGDPTGPIDASCIEQMRRFFPQTLP